MSRVRLAAIAAGIVGLAVIVAVATVLIAPSPQATPATPASVTVTILRGSADPAQQENFSPKVLRVVIGVNNTIVWRSADPVPHTVTSDATEGKRSPDPAFDSAASNSNWLMEEGSTWRFTFTVPGEYTYHCAPHPWMRGSVIVIAGSR